MKERQIANRVLIVLALALFFLGAMAGTLGAWGVTNFGSVHIADTNTTATPVFLVNNTGPSVIAEFQDSGTPVARILDGGSLELQAGFDLNGQALTIDADADTTLQASIDDEITTTLGAATGSFGIATGNLRVGNGANGTALNGEDAYIEGTLEVDGAANFDGTIDADGAATFNSTVDIDGNLTSGTGSITVADTINVTGAADFDTTLNVDGGTTLGTGLTLAAQSSYSVSFGIPITVTGIYNPLISADYGNGDGQVVTDIAAGSTTGDIIIVHNINATQVITIDGTGATVECKADIVLAAGDTIVLLWNGANWNCLSNYDNS